MGVCYYEKTDIQIPIGVVIYMFTNTHQLWPSFKKEACALYATLKDLNGHNA